MGERPRATPPPLDAQARALAVALPKVELHVHLEGTLSSERLTALAARDHVTLDPRALRPLAPGAGFEAFLVAFMARLRALRTPDDWAAALDDLCTAQAAANVVHTEAYVTPTAVIRGEIDAASWRAALAEVAATHRRHGCDVRLVLDCPRPLGPEMCTALVDLATSDPDGLLVGIGIGGPEAACPTAAFAAPFAAAAAAGLGRTAHAGEHDGPGSVRDAVTLLGATRVGHGCRAVEDPAVVDLLRERDVAVDVCPTSNRATGAWDPATGRHPLRRLFDAGVRLTIGSDDPAITGAGIVDEWTALLLEHGMRPHECVGLPLAAVDACFLPADDRARLRARIEAGLLDVQESAADLEAALPR